MALVDCPLPPTLELLTRSEICSSSVCNKELVHLLLYTFLEKDKIAANKCRFGLCAMEYIKHLDDDLEIANFFFLFWHNRGFFGLTY